MKLLYLAYISVAFSFIASSPSTANASPGHSKCCCPFHPNHAVHDIPFIDPSLGYLFTSVSCSSFQGRSELCLLYLSILISYLVLTIPSILTLILALIAHCSAAPTDIYCFLVHCSYVWNTLLNRFTKSVPFRPFST